MAVPKRRVSKARRDKRRSSVWKMSAPELQKCPNCGEYKERTEFAPLAVITTAVRSLKPKRKFAEIF